VATTYRLLPGWRKDDAGTLSALRQCYRYSDRWQDRVTGWLYSDGAQIQALPWPGPLEGLGPVLLAGLKRDTGERFSAVAFQAYRNGTGCDWHYDRDWGTQAILSFGVTRTFGLRNQAGETFLSLAHGDLLVMPPGFQDEWEHGVPVEDAPGERVSLVFRATG
jgi:alkylated DNA repair dioxygenase AlkB